MRKLLADSAKLGGPSFLGRHNDWRSVPAPDLFGGAQAHRNGGAEAHDDDKDNVGGRADRAGLVGTGVQTQVDGTADNGAEGLGGLPDSEVEAAVARGWVADDDGGFAVLSVQRSHLWALPLTPVQSIKHRR